MEREVSKEEIWRRILADRDLLKTLISRHERNALITRFSVMNGLLSGKSFRQISKDTFVSLQTINSIKKAIATKNYRSYFERSKTDRKKLGNFVLKNKKETRKFKAARYSNSINGQS